MKKKNLFLIIIFSLYVVKIRNVANQAAVAARGNFN